jgi:hypothetical protein
MRNGIRGSELVGLLMGEECRATERKKLMD